MKKLFIFFLFLIANLVYSQTDTSIVFSEIMFYPESGNNEFIELYNTSISESIDLSSFKFIYQTSNPDDFIDIGEGTILQPNSFAIILEGDYDLENGIYSDLIPEEALILKIDDNSFGTTGMANSSDREVRLLNTNDDTISVYIYSANNNQSYSDEKIILNRINTENNWANSLFSNGSPGFRNSVTPFNFDLSVSSIDINPSVIIEGDNANITVNVKNVGTETANNFTINIFNDENFDSTGTSGENIFSQSFNNLSPDDSVIATHTILNIMEGNYQLIAEVDFVDDENLLNNILIKQFTVYPPGNIFNDVVINEIMYSPSSDEPEWIELFNNTQDELNLRNWSFADNTNNEIITEIDIEIPANSFIVLSEDSSIINFYNIPVDVIVFDLPSLNNSGDDLKLFDSLGVLIDSVSYLPDWGGGSGKSLERILTDGESNNENNWGTSVNPNNATPGKINSLTPKDYDLAISNFESEKDYGIIGEQINFEITIKNPGLNISNNFTINLFLDENQDSIAQNNELIEQQSGLPISPNDSSIINISTINFNEGENYFITKLETSQDDDSTNNIAFTNVTGVQVLEVRNDLVINEIMYTPESPEPEWIEIFNKSEKTINLKNYKIADNNDTVQVIDQSSILQPEEFLIIADDSSIVDVYNIPSQLIISSFPALNNTGDKLIFLDSLNRTIDSLKFNSSWGGTGGKSLERINANGTTTDSSNWKTSISRINATPGFLNSVSQKDFDLILIDIIFSPKNPLFGDNVSISAKVKNIGINNSTFSIQLFEDTNLDSIPDNLISTISNQNLSGGDSSIISLDYSINNIQNEKAFYTEIIFEQDQDTSNNYFYKTVAPGYPEGTIVINEIMFTPQGGEPEWIEIYNTSEDSINLFNWSINDVITTPAYGTVDYNIFIPSHSYLILTDDTSIVNYHRIIPSKIVEVNLPNLNNDADGVVLKDNRKAQMDSVLYSIDWGGDDGYSLERLSIEAGSNLQTNWASSIDLEQSTPGRINSVTPKENDLLIKEISFQPRFPVPGENVFIKAKIFNNGINPANNFTVKFYIDSNNDNEVDLLLDQQTINTLSSEDSLNIISKEAINNIQEKTLCAVNIIFNKDEDTLNNYAEETVEPGFPQNSVLVNEVLYSPEIGYPEWIELINVSDDTLNLQNWSVSDILSSPTKNYITNNELLFYPDEFLIITSDTSFYSLYPEVESKIEIVNFGTLGNSEDGIMIYDFRDAIIDSLLYNSDWGGAKGYSLERISLEVTTNDSSNWSTSLSFNGSTPGKENSLKNISDYEKNSVVINEIMFEPSTENSEFIEFYNTTNDSINIGGWRIEDENGNYFKLSEVSKTMYTNDYFVLAADSNFLNFYNLSIEENVSLAEKSSLGLSNSGELILLKDVRGNIIDSVFYSDDWHNKNFNTTKNISLERINPELESNNSDNWNSSVNIIGATPLKKNSIFTNLKNSNANISLSPNPFSPDNDGFEDFTIISYNLTQAVAQIRIKIFDSRGRLVRTLLNNSASGSSGKVIFDGLGNDGRALRMGIYIVFLEALNGTSGVVENLKTTVVVARKLN